MGKLPVIGAGSKPNGAGSKPNRTGLKADGAGSKGKRAVQELGASAVLLTDLHIMILVLAANGQGAVQNLYTQLGETFAVTAPRTAVTAPRTAQRTVQRTQS